MPKETKAQLAKRSARIIGLLSKRHPDARTALNFSNPLELLVATILSAQCTDKRVNVVTEPLFKKYKTAADYAAADERTFQEQIRTTGFFRNKAKAITAAGAKLVSDFGGQVPDTMEGLLCLPGVARKTANVVLGSAFGKNEGVVVDRHVARVAGRLKLTGQTKPEKIEQDLMRLVPRQQWTLFSHLLIWHGRATCTARKPDCAGCVVNRLCPSAFEV